MLNAALYENQLLISQFLFHIQQENVQVSNILFKYA